MDCRTCEPTLIDLVHSELATDAAREAHAHLATCVTCRASFETLVAATRLAAQLPMVEPPAHIAPRVMELAQAHAREASARLKVVLPRPTPWQALLDFVGRLATRPQVAMATVMVLIVSVGLWSLPRLRQPQATAGGVVVNPEPEGEAAPSTGVEPAERLDLKVDMRAGRIRSKDGAPVATAVPAAAPAAPEPAPAADAPEQQKLAAQTRNAEDPLATLDEVDDLGDNRRADSPAREELAQRKVAELPAKREAKSKSAALDRDFAAEPPPPASASANATAATEAESARAEARPQADKGSAETAGAMTRLGQSAGSLGYAQGQRGGGEGSGVSGPSAPASASASARPKPSAPAGATERPAAASKPSSLQPSSLADQLTAARAYAKQNGCVAAMPRYQRVVMQAPSSAEAGSALIEMAQCRRGAGDLDSARSFLERAANIPEVANRANAMLDALPSDGAKRKKK